MQFKKSEPFADADTQSNSTYNIHHIRIMNTHSQKHHCKTLNH